MSQLFSGLTRSELMSHIRSRGNKNTELALMRVFRAHGITGGGGISQSSANRTLSSPSFGSRCSWMAASGTAAPRHASQPKNNVAFWQKKFAANQARDRLVSRTLRRAGWRVLRGLGA